MASKTRLALGALGAGAAGAYFFDSSDGKRRRHVARDKAVAALRRPAKRVAAETRRKASYASGVLQGTAHEAGKVEESLKGPEASAHDSSRRRRQQPQKTEGVS